MQTAVQHMPAHLVHQYPRTSLATANMNPNGVATPPLAARKRKRARQYTVNYSEVQEYDPDGKLREVIVIEDTPPPPTVSPATTVRTNGFSASYQPPQYSAQVRTRARAAKEAEALSTTTSVALQAPPPKKRKRDVGDVPQATRKVAPPSSQQAAVDGAATVSSWATSSAATTTNTVDVRPPNLPTPASPYSYRSLRTTAIKGPTTVLRRQGGSLHYCPGRHYL